MASLGPELGENRGIELAVRIGIHTGQVVAGEVGDAEQTENLAVGSTPNIAARVQACAEPGDVLMTADSQELVGPSVRSVC